MARKVLITLTTAGSQTGPFQLYSNVDSYGAPFETGISRSSIVAGYTSYLVPDGASVIKVVSTGTCTSQVYLTISGLPTPTPTATPTNTPTLTPTATPTPTVSAGSAIVYFDLDYTGLISICDVDGGKTWSRLTAAAGTTITLSLDVTHYVTSFAPGKTSGAISGSLYTTTLPSTDPTVGTLLATVNQPFTTVPSFVSNYTTYSFTMPSEGYKDLAITYSTSNIGGNYKSGYAELRVSQVNGVPVDGDSIAARYPCTDLV